MWHGVEVGGAHLLLSGLHPEVKLERCASGKVEELTSQLEIFVGVFSTICFML